MFFSWLCQLFLLFLSLLGWADEARQILFLAICSFYFFDLLYQRAHFSSDADSSDKRKYEDWNNEKFTYVFVRYRISYYKEICGKCNQNKEEQKNLFGQFSFNED